MLTRPLSLPWKETQFEGWTIVGMNHYHANGRRSLFIAMTDEEGHCIKVEGPDDQILWDELAQNAAKFDRSHLPRRANV